MSVRSQVRAWMPVIVAGGVVVAGALVAIPFGGWDTVQLQSAQIPEQPIGQPYHGARLSTAVDDIYLTDEHPDGYSEPEPGFTWLVVVTTMENELTTPQYPIGTRDFWAFTIPGVIELGEPLSSADYGTLLERDGTFGPVLQPGVPDTILTVFAVRANLFADGDEVAVGLTDAEQQDADLYDGIRWWNPRVVAQVPVVIRDER
jgi:hypothetical protein